MNCQEFWNRTTELDPGAPLDQERTGHLAECSGCAALLRREGALTAALAALAAEARRVQAPARVEARLVTAFRQHNGLSSSRRPGHFWIPILTWASAAVAMFALALFLVRTAPWSRPPNPASIPAHRETSARPEWAAAQIPADVDSDADPSGLDSGFIPLPNTPRVGPDEEVNLVRMEVPRSTMVALGYVVSAERAAEPVQAEVMLGSDGLARAVRFVDE